MFGIGAKPLRNLWFIRSFRVKIPIFGVYRIPNVQAQI